MSYEALLKDLRAFHSQDVKRILEKIRLLANDPRPTGYRIVHEIEDQIPAVVVKIGHQRDVYRGR